MTYLSLVYSLLGIHIISNDVMLTSFLTLQLVSHNLSANAFVPRPDGLGLP